MSGLREQGSGERDDDKEQKRESSLYSGAHYEESPPGSRAVLGPCRTSMRQNLEAVAEQGVGRGPIKKNVGYMRRAELKQVALRGQLRARAENFAG